MYTEARSMNRTYQREPRIMDQWGTGIADEGHHSTAVQGIHHRRQTALLIVLVEGQQAHRSDPEVL